MDQFGAACVTLFQFVAAGLGIFVAGRLVQWLIPALPSQPTTGKEFLASHPDFTERPELLG